MKEITDLRSSYPFPEFALKHNMAKRKVLGAGVAFILFIIFLLFRTGIITNIWKIVSED